MVDVSNLSARDFERASAAASFSASQEEGEDVKAALERAFAKQLAAKTAVLVATPKGWQVVLLRKLKPAQRELLLSKVYEDTTHPLGCFSKLTERMAKAGVPVPAVVVRFKGLTVKGKQVVQPSGPPQKGLLPKLKVGNKCMV